MRLPSACSCSRLFILCSSSVQTVWCASPARSPTVSSAPTHRRECLSLSPQRIQTVVGCRVLCALSSHTLVPLSFLSYWPFSPSSSSTFFFSCFTSWSRSCTQNQNTMGQPPSLQNVFSLFFFCFFSKLQTVMRVICNLLQDKNRKRPKSQPTQTVHVRESEGRTVSVLL